MANRFWVGGGGNWDQTTTTNWSTTTGGAGGSAVPTAADDVFFDANSGVGTVTLTVSAPCRSLNSAGASIGTFTHNASIVLTIGDATAGASNVALDLSGFTTYTLGSTTTSTITFASTSTTQQSITYGGHTVASQTFNGVAGSWQFADAMTVTAGSTSNITLTNGSLDTNGQSVTANFAASSSNTKSLTLGATTWTTTNNGGGSINWNMNASGTTLSAASSTIVIPNFSTTFAGGGMTYGTLNMTGASSNIITGSNTFATLTRTATATKTDTFLFTSGTTQTVTGTLTISGNSSVNRVLVSSVTRGSDATLSAATVTVTNADFRDMTGAGAGSWNLSAITGLSGDCGGNTNITFTSALSNYWIGGTGNWDAVAEWASSSGGASSSGRVPLVQDTAVFDANSFSAGSQTVTQNMSRIGTVTWSGVTNTPTFTTTTAASCFGSFTLESGMTFSASSQAYIFEGRSTYSITSAGKTFNKAVSFEAPGGTYTLADAFIQTNSNLTHTYGTLTAVGNVTTNLFSSSNSNTRVINMGSGTWDCFTTTATTAWTCATSTGLTLNADTSTIKFSGSTTNVRTFAGGGQTYYNFLFSNATAAGGVDFSGSNTFNAMSQDQNNAQTIRFTASTTTTLISSTFFSGIASNLITINSTTTTDFNLVKSGGGVVSCDYLNIQNCDATPASTWYAGANSVDNQAASGGTGWIFTVPPGGPAAADQVYSNFLLMNVG